MVFEGPFQIKVSNQIPFDEDHKAIREGYIRRSLQGGFFLLFMITYSWVTQSHDLFEKCRLFKKFKPNKQYSLHI